MSLFSKIKESTKSLSERIRGKSGMVLEFKLGKEFVHPGEILSFEVKLTSTAPVNARRVSIFLREIEETNLGFSRTSEEERESGKTHGQQPLELISFEEEFPIYGELHLEEGETKIIRGEIIFPIDAQPTYVGKTVGHEWEIEAVAEILNGANIRERYKIPVRHHLSKGEGEQTDISEVLSDTGPGGEIEYPGGLDLIGETELSETYEEVPQQSREQSEEESLRLPEESGELRKKK